MVSFAAPGPLARVGELAAVRKIMDRDPAVRAGATATRFELCGNTHGGPGRAAMG
jgi:hypothetical protein